MVTDAGPLESAPTPSDWRAAAAAEYRARRDELLKKVEAATRAEQRAGEKRAEAERDLGELDIGAKAFGIDVFIHGIDGPTAIETKNPQTDGDGQSARQIILTALEAAYPTPMRAANLKRIIEQELGREVHYKTPGMTLYRLAEQKLVRREGRDWHLVRLPATGPANPAEPQGANDFDFDQEDEMT